MMETCTKIIVDDLPKGCAVSGKCLNEENGGIISEEDLECNMEKEHPVLGCESTGPEEGISQLSDQPGDAQTMRLAFPITDEGFRSGNPIRVTVIDGQVIQLTSRSVLNSNRKSKRVGLDRNHEQISAGSPDAEEKPMEKSLTFITSNEKAYILPHGISSEGDYLLAEEVLCEGILHSNNMLPEEQIQPIPSPSSVEFSTGGKPDALAIAASEVFNDGCVSLPMQDNRCVSGSIEHQLSTKKFENVSRETSCEIYNGDSYSVQESPSYPVCVGVNRLTSNFADKLDTSKFKVEQIYLLGEASDQMTEGKKNRFLKEKETLSKTFESDDVYNYNAKPSRFNNGSTDLINESNQAIDSAPSKIIVNEDKISDLKRRTQEERERGGSVADSSVVELQPISVDGTTHQLADCRYERNSEDQMTPPLGSALRRSPRTPRVKKDPDFSGSSCSEGLQGRKKRRTVRGEMKRPLWDCLKCDAMFRTKASRNRHLQEGHLFTCYMCKWQGLTKMKYELHISTFHCNQKARCLMCRKDFPSYSEYREHLKVKHPQVAVGSGKSKDPVLGNCEESTDAVKGTSVESPNQSDAEEMMIDDSGYEQDKADDGGGKTWREMKDFPSYSEYKEHLKVKHPQMVLAIAKSKDFVLDNCGESTDTVKGTSVESPNQSDAEEMMIDDSGYEHDKTECGGGKTFREMEETIDIETFEMDEGKRVCPYCRKTFERYHHFVRHLNYHVGKKAFACKICGKSFVEKSGMEAHVLTHNPINEPCPQCGRICKTHQTMKRHLRTHMNNLYSCNTCHKQFRHKESLRVHKSMHKEGGSGNVCTYCEKDCMTPYYLQQHMTNKHQTPKFRCNICNRSFKWKQSYHNHMVIHNENSGATAKLKCVMTNPELNIHRFKHSTEKKYVCDPCGKVFRHKYTRDKHIKIVHHEEREHMCSQCGALFKAKVYLDQHLAQVHTTKERVKCQTCGHDFKTQSILKSHVKLVHKSTNGKYSCQICKKTFSAPKDLHRHNKVHTGEKNHICPVCRRCFSRKDNMTSHLRTHSRDMQDSITIPSDNSDVAKDVQQSGSRESLHILRLSPVVPTSSNNVTSSNLQPISSTSASIMDSVTSLVSGSITFSTLPLPSISLPSNISNPLSNTVVYSNTSESSTCIVISSRKPPSSTLPVMDFSGSVVSNSHLLSNSQPPLSNVSLGNIHPTINDFPVNPSSMSPSNLSSVTTLTYCNNAIVSLASSSSNNIYTVPTHQTSSASPHLSLSSINPVSSNSDSSCVENVSQDASVFSPSLHADQIVLTEEVLASTSAISS